VIYRFDQYVVDDQEFRLSASGAPVQLEPKSLRLLLYLVENRNRLVRKQELLDNVWPDAVVTENALTRGIGQLRKALNDDSHEPRCIETVPTAGYRFIAKVDVVEDTPVEPKTLTGTTPAVPQHRKGFSKSIKWILALILLVLAVEVGGDLLFGPHRKKAVLTAKDTIVLADFTNSTGDPLFDDMLRQGMRVQLEQSPFLSLVTDERIRQVLRFMGQPDTQLTPPVAREICERTASAAVLDGSISSLGSQYVLGLRATDCRSGKVLAEEQVQAARKEDVLHALDQIASRVRTRLGESLATVEKYGTPLAEATTPSLEASKFYTMGAKKYRAGQLTASLPFFRRAVERDPEFAMAYADMARVYISLQQPERAGEYSRMAYQLREKVSERERLSIEAAYYTHATGELDKALSVYELWQQTYPRDYVPFNSAGATYRRLGNREKALEQHREALRLSPDSAAVYQNLGADYVNLNQLKEAEAIYKQTEDLKLEFQGHTRSRYLLAFLTGDTIRMAQLAKSATGRSGIEDVMLATQADTAAWYGRLKDSRELTRRAIESAQRDDAKEHAASYQANAALFEAETGNPKQARVDIDAAMKLDPSRDTRMMAALVIARTGDPVTAEKQAVSLDKDFPSDTLIQRYWLPVIRGAVALQRKDPDRAAELLQMESPMDLAEIKLLPAYLRGQAFLALHDGNRAQAEFQKFIDYRSLVRNAPTGALARLGLARACAMQGHTAKARAAYQDFMTIWKDADSDVPILQQAKAEYAKLQ
jgi:eukaryotic-like serine/threonine-protein kinase